jgi:hypothetical protein
MLGGMSELREQFRRILVEQIVPGFGPELPLAQQRLALEAVGAQAQARVGAFVRGKLGI